MNFNSFGSKSWENPEAPAPRETPEIGISPEASAPRETPEIGMAPFQPVRQPESGSNRRRKGPVPSVDETNLLEVVNALQTGNSLHIDLPQIVVLGCQSAGKSSVLERLVGKEFLPRGKNLVTRMPIIVQMTPSDDEYGVVFHKGNEKQFTDFSAIREEITKITDEECGPTGFSANPICVKIYSPRVLKLTVIDLPGIVKVAVDAQSDETAKIVRDILMVYIKNPKAIILAVSPSQQISNSDALELAKEVDPERKRTIGVLTKLDVEEDASDVLKNSILRLEKGWVGVVNRSEQETKDGKDMDYITKKEENFFRNSPFYSDIAHHMGIPYLQKLLQKNLRSAIKDGLPAVRDDISTKLSRCERELKEFQSVIGDEPNAKQLYLVRLIQKFADDLKIKIMGCSVMVPTSTLAHGAIIKFVLNTEVQRIISQVDLLPNEDDIVKAIANIDGIRNPISVPSLALESICRTLIVRFKDPLDSSVLCIKHILLHAVEDSAKLLDACPSLKREAMHQVKQWIHKKCEATKDILKTYIEEEMHYININHPGFDSSECDSIAPQAGPTKVWKHIDANTTAENNGDANSTAQNNGPTFEKLLANDDQMQKQVQYVKALVINYTKIVRVQVADTTIKKLTFHLVKKVVDAIAQDLVPVVLSAANFASIAEDFDDEIRRKEEIVNTCNLLREALRAIESFLIN